MRIPRFQSSWLAVYSAAILVTTAPTIASASPAGADPQGRARGRYEQAQEHRRFDERDRDAVRMWSARHRQQPIAGFRYRDRIPPRYGFNIGIGRVLTPEVRRYAHGVPVDLRRQLPPVPYGYRYLIVDGHLCLVDNYYRVQDVIQIGWWG